MDSEEKVKHNSDIEKNGCKIKEEIEESEENMPYVSTSEHDSSSEQDINENNSKIKKEIVELEENKPVSSYKLRKSKQNKEPCIDDGSTFKNVKSEDNGDDESDDEDMDDSDENDDNDSDDSDFSDGTSIKEVNLSGDDGVREPEVVYVKSELIEQNEETLVCEVDYPCYEPDANGEKPENKKAVTLKRTRKPNKTVEGSLIIVEEPAKRSKMPYFCAECNKHFSKVLNYRRHLKRHKGKFQCKVCNRLFNADSELKEHVEEHSGSDKFRCHVCNRLYSTKSNLKKHLKQKHNMRVHRSDGDGKVKPVLIKPKDQNNLEDEIKAVMRETTEYRVCLPYQHVDTNKDTPFLCCVCNKAFSKYQNLKQHMQIHSGLAHFTCDLCNKSYSRKAHLKEHYKTHTDSDRFLCTVCNKRFNWKHNWIAHMEVHSGIERYVCDVCGKTYAMKDSLAKHMAGHNAEYTCEICGKVFNRKVNLKEHMNIHTGMKRFSCEICNKEFNFKCNWKTHMEMHSGMFTYFCNLCNKSYSFKSTYLRHMLVKHNIPKSESVIPLNESLNAERAAALSLDNVEAVYTESAEDVQPDK